MSPLSLSLRMLKGRYKLLGLSSILIVLASSLIIGFLLTADYLVYVNAHSTYMSLPVDYTAYARFANRPILETYNSIKVQIENIEYVTGCHYLFDGYMYKVDIINLNTNTTHRIEEIGIIILGLDFNDEFWINQLKLVGNESELPLNPNEIIVDYDFGQWLNVSVGDSLFFKRYDTEIQAATSITLKGFFIPKDFLEYHLKNIEQVIYYGVIIASTETAMNLIGWLYTDPPYTFRYHVWINREKAINPWDRRVTLRRLNAIEAAITGILMHTRGIYQLSVDSHIEYTMGEFYTNAEKYSSQFILGVLIIFIFVALATIIGGELTIETRRREIGLLKIRGASNRSASFVMLSEWLITGLLGGILGFLVSPPISYLFVIYTTPHIAHEYNVFGIIIRALSQYFIVAIIIGLALSILAVILPTRRVADIKPLDAIREYYEPMEVGYVKSINRKFNLALVIISMYFLFEFLNNMPIATLLLTYAQQMGTSIFINLAEILYFLELTVMPLAAPFLLVIALVNLIVSVSEKISKLLQKITRPFLGELSLVASKNFARKPTRTILILFLLTVTLITQVTFSSGVATAKNHVIVDTKMSIGADIKVDITSLRPIDFINRTIYRPLLEMEEVESVVRVFIKSFGQYGSIGKTKLIAIDPIYFKQSYFRESYLSYINIEDAYKTLLSGNGTLVNIGAHNGLGINISDMAYIRDPYVPTKVVLTLRVLGFFKFLPGVFENMLHPQESMSVAYFLVNPDKIIKALERYRYIYTADTSILLIKLKDKKKINDVVSQIRAILDFYDTKANIYIYQEVLKNRLETQISGALLSLYEIGILYALTLISLVIFVTISISVYERRRELALLRVRGFIRNKIIKMLVGEAAISIIIALVLGIPIAMSVVASWVSGAAMMLPYLRQYFATTSGFEYPEEWSLIIIPNSIFYYVLLIIIGFILSYIVPYLIVSRNPLPEEVRIHH